MKGESMAIGTYSIEKYKYDELKDNLKVPKYQRPVVWSKDEKMNFITSLHKGYPFGSLLLYRFEDDLNKYTLIDGQQRFTTMDDYAKNPSKYFPIGDSEFVDEILDIAALASGNSLTNSVSQSLRSKFNKIIESFLAEYVGNPSSITPFYLRDEVCKIFPLIKNNRTAEDSLLSLQQKVTDEFNGYINLSSIDIPCIIYKGDVSDLPEVFARVNLGGRKLTKYQVFAASWSNYQVTLADEKNASSEQILNNVIDRYDKLTEDRGGLEIEDYDATQLMKSREITLPEFCHALGQEILRASPACWSKKTQEDDDVIDTIGYNSLAIVFGVTPKNITDLTKMYHGSGLEDNPEAVDVLISKVLVEYKVINSEFAKYLHKPGKESGSSNADNFENSKAVGQLQFLSFFAALWRIKYGVGNTKLTCQSGYKRNYDRTRNQLFGSYLIDFLGNQWKGSGDSRLANYIDGGRTYLSSVDSDALLQTLYDWAEQEDQVPSVNIDSVTKILLTIFASANPEAYNKPSYDFEHIIARKYLVEKVNGTPRYKLLKLAGGRIGNIMLLDSNQNRSKGPKSLIDVAGEEMRINSERSFYPTNVNDIEFNLKDGKTEPFVEMTKNRRNKIFNVIVKRVIG